MKQGILIIGYKDIQHLIDIIEFFNDDEFYYYIHLKKEQQVSTIRVGKIT